MKRAYIVFILSVIITFLVIAIIIKQTHITTTYLNQHKDTFTPIKDLITVIAIGLAIIFAYYKFFIGKKYAVKGNVSISVTLIETPFNTIFHTVKIAFVNSGDIAIWLPSVTLEIKSLGTVRDTTDKEIVKIEKEISLNQIEKNQSVVNSGETIFFIYQREFSKEIWAVNYTAEVISNFQWSNMACIKNAIEQKKD
jgi:hypothetical protein